MTNVILLIIFVALSFVPSYLIYEPIKHYSNSVPENKQILYPSHITLLITTALKAVIALLYITSKYPQIDLGLSAILLVLCWMINMMGDTMITVAILTLTPLNKRAPQKISDYDKE